MKTIIITLFVSLFIVSCSNNKNEHEKLEETNISKKIKQNDERLLFPDFVALNETDFKKFKESKSSKWFKSGDENLYFVPYTDYSITTLILTNEKLTDKYFIGLLTAEKINAADEINAIKIGPIITDKKIKLGVSKQYVEQIYGESDSLEISGNKESIFWNFKMKDNRKEYLGGNLTPFILEGLEFSVEMTFKNNRLTTLIYSYEVP